MVDIIVSLDLERIARNLIMELDIINVTILCAPYLPENTWLIKKDEWISLKLAQDYDVEWDINKLLRSKQW